MFTDWDADEADLQITASALRARLGLDDELAALGSVTVTGSSALRVMVARDLDLTVDVGTLTPDVLRDVAALGARLAVREDVRDVLVRNDTGRWNTDPRYPDGLYLRLQAQGDDHELWSIDIWFIDDPDRQPDLQHLGTLRPRILPAEQAVILAIKRFKRWELANGDRMPSVEVYHAVLDQGVTDAAQFRSYMGSRLR